MAEALPEDGAVVTCECEPYLVETARKWFDETPFGKRIDIRQGPALDSLDQLAAEGQTFDVVYLDADEPNYTAYFKKLLDLGLLAEGGTLMVDNSLFHGFPYTQPGSTVDLFNKAVMDDDRVEQILLPIFDGVSLIRRKGE
ncbi:caffeoyl-CoA O-methyltransferase-like [Haliotis rubra]|uniref:caffeoyl-CoA O-methyltransferase-like n=1 Tax=Haliotis rubra TaxID=36100 RepID=UPI001EE5FE53|nr:caffeoyl-CoA O-methyltransferase-like [Haliotis rubra]